jgi:hypothetical protein
MRSRLFLAVDIFGVLRHWAALRCAGGAPAGAGPRSVYWRAEGGEELLRVSDGSLPHGCRRGACATFSGTTQATFTRRACLWRRGFSGVCSCCGGRTGVFQAKRHTVVGNVPGRDGRTSSISPADGWRSNPAALYRLFVAATVRRHCRSAISGSCALLRRKAV